MLSANAKRGTTDRAILLLDAHCGPCSEFGKQIENEGLTGDSILEIGSLHDQRYTGPRR